jgi:hypothetical protein
VRSKVFGIFFYGLLSFFLALAAFSMTVGVPVENDQVRFKTVEIFLLSLVSLASLYIGYRIVHFKGPASDQPVRLRRRRTKIKLN